MPKPKIVRFGSSNVRSKQPISQGGTGGGLLTKRDINRNSTNLFNRNLKRTTDNRIFQIQQVQQKMKDQDDALLASSNSGEYLGNLLVTKDELIKDARKTGNYQDLVPKFQEKASELKDTFLNGITDNETSFRVEEALQKYEISQTVAMQQQQFSVRNEINQKRLRDSILSAAKVAGASKSTDAGILLANTVLGNLESGDFSPTVVKQMRSLASEQIVERAVSSVIVSDPKQALKDLEPGGKLSSFLTPSKMNTLRARAKASSNIINSYDRAKFDQDFVDMISQIENKGSSDIKLNFDAITEKQLPGIKFKVNEAINVAQKTHEVKKLFETSSIKDYSKEIKKLSDQADTSGKASDRKLLIKAKRTASTMISEFSSDPVAAELKHNPLAREAARNFQSDHNAVKYVDEMDRLLTARGATLRIFTDSQAKSIAENLNRTKSTISLENEKNATELSKQMSELEKEYGKHFPRALDELTNEGKLDKNVIIAFSYSNNPALQKAIIKGSQIKDSEFANLVPDFSELKQDINAKLFEEGSLVSQFLRTHTKGNLDTLGPVSNFRQALISVTKSYLVENGGNVDDAFEKAQKQMIDEIYFPFSRGNEDPSVFIPRFAESGDKLPVEGKNGIVDMMDILGRSPGFIKNDFGKENLALLQGTSTQEETANIIANSGVYRDVGNGTEFYIEVPTVDGGTKEILNKDEGLLKMKYEDVLNFDRPKDTIQRQSVIDVLGNKASFGIVNQAKKEADQTGKDVTDLLLEKLVKPGLDAESIPFEFMKKAFEIFSPEDKKSLDQVNKVQKQINKLKESSPKQNENPIIPKIDNLLKKRELENKKLTEQIKADSKHISKISESLKKSQEQFTKDVEAFSSKGIQSGVKKIEKSINSQKEIDSKGSITLEKAKNIKKELESVVNKNALSNDKLNLEIFPGVSPTARKELITFQLVRNSLKQLVKPLKRFLEKNSSNKETKNQLKRINSIISKLENPNNEVTAEDAQLLINAYLKSFKKK